eukprot:1390893-Pyramimonas_sp.AAC.1
MGGPNLLIQGFLSCSQLFGAGCDLRSGESTSASEPEEELPEPGESDEPTSQVVPPAGLTGVFPR